MAQTPLVTRTKDGLEIQFGILLVVLLVVLGSYRNILSWEKCVDSGGGKGLWKYASLYAMDSISKLSALFAEFPGIGARQSKRFVYFLLKRDRGYIKELVRQIEALEGTVFECTECHRFFMKKHVQAPNLCTICTDGARDKRVLMIVEKDSDLEALERSGSFKGLYFVLGGTLPILEKNPESKIRINALTARITRENDELDEIIIACAVTPESEHTADFVEGIITPLISSVMTKVTHLGRGLSTGTELEYSDADTLRYALEGRK